MPHAFVRIYLYALIIGSTVLLLLAAIILLMESKGRHSLERTKTLIRDFFFLVSGLAGFYIFSGRLLNDWMILGLVFGMLLISMYLTEGIGKLLSKRRQNNDAG